MEKKRVNSLAELIHLGLSVVVNRMTMTHTKLIVISSFGLLHLIRY